MKPMPFAVCLFCLVVGAILGHDLWQRAQRRPDPTPEPRETAPPDAHAQDGESDRPRKNPEVTPPEPGRMPAWQFEDVRRAVSEWRFAEADGTALDRARATARVASLRAEWNLKRALSKRVRPLMPDLPEEVEHVTLNNGRSLWARSVRETGPRTELVFVSGVSTGFATDEIRERKQRPRSQYLADTSVEYRNSLEGLPDEPAALEAAVARALGRADHSAADTLFARWLLCGGADSLVRRLGVEEGETVRSAAIVLSMNMTPADAPAKPDVATAREPAKPRLDYSVPASVEGLDRKLRKMRGEVTPRLSSERRQRFLDQLEVWEGWLIGPARDEVRSEDELARLQKEIQFLRLDILKTGGF